LNKNIFGTDGIRGIANTEFSADVAFRLGKSFAIFISQNIDKPTICVGRDTRPSGDTLVSAFVAGALSMGVDILDVGVAPTPAISYLVRSLELSAGVVITASHNLAEYNGIKFMDASGIKLDCTAEMCLSQIFHNIADYLPSQSVGNLTMDIDKPKLWADYLMQCVDCVNLSNLRIAIDCAHGAGYRAVPYVLKSLGANVHCLNCDDVGANINLDCGSTSVEALVTTIQQGVYDIGLAFDGDADRLVVVDNSGNVLSGDDILFVLAKYLSHADKLTQNTIVATTISNHGLDQSLAQDKINVVRVEVGDKWVLQELLRHGYNLGGEDSGHIILPEFNYSADALLTALYLLRILQSTGKSLTDLLTGFHRYERVNINIPVTMRQLTLVRNGALDKYIDALQAELGADGTFLVRPSGTENVVRILVEGNNLTLITSIADKLKNLTLEL